MIHLQLAWGMLREMLTLGMSFHEHAKGGASSHAFCRLPLPTLVTPLLPFPTPKVSLYAYELVVCWGTMVTRKNINSHF